MLFEILWFHGYVRLSKYSFEIDGQSPETWPLEKGWREMLPPELHVFAGNFLGQSFQDVTPFRFQPGFPPKVLLAPPPSGKTVSRVAKKPLIQSFETCVQVLTRCFPAESL